MFSHLELHNFRSYKDAEFEFGPGVNIVIGPNGSGKTNLLEALYVLSRGHTFRGEAGALIRDTSDWARVDARFAGRDYTLKLQAGEPSPRKTILKNDAAVRSSGIKVVLFEPDQLRMIHGPPELRRSWLDELLSQLEAAYSLALKNYQRALRQRNALLDRGGDDDLFVWEIKMSEYGAVVASSRRQLVAKFGEKVGELYQAVSGSTSRVGLAYLTPFGEQYGSHFLQALGQRRSIDRQRGFTTIGPHREDLDLRFDNAPASRVASRGERRTLYLTLKFLEAGLVESAFKQKAVLLLDDLFGELDDRRKRHLQRALKDNQIIITSTDDHPAGVLPASKRVIQL